MCFDGCIALRYDEIPKMNFCRLSVAWVLVGTTVVAGPVAAHGQQQFSSGSRKIEFSAPRGSLTASNLSEMTRPKPSPLNLDGDLGTPNEIFHPSSSLQGIGAPTMQRPPASPVSPVTSKRLKELMENRQDWQFLEPEDYHSQPTLEELFGVPEYGANGETKEKKSPLERFYERLDRANVALTNRTKQDGLLFGMGFGVGKKNDNSSTDLNLGGLENGRGAISEIENPLIQLFRGDTGNPLFPGNMRSAADPDGFRQFDHYNPATLDSTRAQAARIEEFKRILGTHTAPALPSGLPVSGLAPFNSLDPSSAPSAATAFAPLGSTDPLPAAPNPPARDPFTAFPATVGTTPRPFELPVASTSLPDLTTPSTPLPEPARTVVPTPDFSIPKRRF